MRYIISILFILCFGSLSQAEIVISKDEALKLAFPDADQIEKKQVFLSIDQKSEIEQIAKEKIKSRFYVFYVAKKGDNYLGSALIETHILRTKTETVLYVIDTNGCLKQAEILAFYEPSEYKPGNKWMKLFNHKDINDSLRVGKDIPNITGATITSYSFTQSVKRVLAIYEVAFPDSILVKK